MAATVVERIVVGLGFATDEASASRAVKSYEAVAHAAQDVAAAIGSALVAVAGFTLGMAENVAATQDLANSLSLSTEEYTALAYAADMAGISQEKMKVGLMTLQRQLGAAGRGSKEAGALFAKLGVSVTDANGELKTSSQALLEVADGIQQLGSDGEKSAVLLQLFGESGGAFKDLFKDGAKGVQELTDKAAELGIVLDSDVAEAGAQLDDSFQSLKKVVGALGLSFADDLFPPMKVLVEQLSSFLSDADGIVRVGLDRAAKGMAAAFAFLATDAGKAAGAIGLVAAGLSAARNAQGVLGLIGQAGPAGAAVANLGKSFGVAAAGAAKFAIPIALVALVLEDFYVTAEGGDSLTRRLADSMGIGEETARSFAAGLKILGNSFEFALVLGGEAFKQFEEFNNFLRDNMLQTLDDIAGAVTKIGTAIGVDLSPVTDLIESAKGLLPDKKEAAGGIAGALEEAAKDTSALVAGAKGADGLGFAETPIADKLPFVGVGTYLTRSARERALSEQSFPPLMGQYGRAEPQPLNVNTNINVSVDSKAAVEKELSKATRAALSQLGSE